MTAIKHIPNIITILRIILCVPLLLVVPLSLWFAALYLCCGISDILDGFLARKIGAVSKCGALLDSIADMVFVVVVLAKLIPVVVLPWGALIWVTVITIVKLVSLAVGYRKYHALAFLHTYANKATGALLFCFPVLLCAGPIGLAWPVYVVCGVASLAASEELAINIVSKELMRDIKSIFLLAKGSYAS